MWAKYAVIYCRCKWKVVEQISEVLPHVGVAIFAQAFVIEAVHLSDLTRFVISSKDCYTVSVAHLGSS